VAFPDIFPSDYFNTEYNDGDYHIIMGSDVYGPIGVDDGYPGSGTQLDLYGAPKLGPISELPAAILASCGSSTVNVYDWNLGIFDFVSAYENSTLTFHSGFCAVLKAYDESHVELAGGDIEGFRGYGNSSLAMSGGHAFDILLYDSSNLVMTGGHTAWIETSGNSHVEIWGGTFGYDMEPGVVLSDSVDLYVRDYEYNEATGELSGTFASGEEITNVWFNMDEINIIIVPEPATLALLAIGGLALLQKRK